MKHLSPLIRLDREFDAFLCALDEQLLAPRPLPLVVNGLSRGADDAFLLEAVCEAHKRSSAPVLVLTQDEASCERYRALLSGTELRVCHFPERDLNLHSMSASHDTERERLSVLAALLGGACDVVVTTPTAAS